MRKWYKQWHNHVSLTFLQKAVSKEASGKSRRKEQRKRERETKHLRPQLNWALSALPGHKASLVHPQIQTALADGGLPGSGL